jgi:myosin-9
VPYSLTSSQADVRDFLYTLNLNRDNYQLGTTKIFLRESEKVKLDYRLHQQIMASIVAIQRWTRAILERRRFLRLREAVILIQVRTFCHHECMNEADHMTVCFVHASQVHNLLEFD